MQKWEKIISEVLLQKTVFTAVVILIMLFILIHSKRRKDTLKQCCSGQTIGKFEGKVSGKIVTDKGLVQTYHNGVQMTRPASETEIFQYWIYSYYVNGVQYFETDARGNIHLLSAEKVGNDVELYYDPKNPKIMYCPSENIAVVEYLIWCFVAAGVVWWMVF